MNAPPRNNPVSIWRKQVIRRNAVTRAGTAIVFLTLALFFGAEARAITPPRADFNGDCHPDLGLGQHHSDKTAVWYMNGTTLIGGAYGPNQPAGWKGVGAADFNGDGHPDLLWWNPTTRQTAIWYLNGVQFLSGVLGPTLPAGWAPVLVDDFNRGGKPDLVLWNQSTRQTAIWHLNNYVFMRGVLGPTLPAGWILVGPR